MDVKDRDGAEWLLRIAPVMQPGIDGIRLWVARQMEYFDDPLPNRLPIENLFHRDTGGVRSASSHP